MTTLTEDQRKKTLDMAAEAEEIMRRARAGEATPAEVSAATDALLKQFADENATGDAVKSAVTGKDIAVRKPLQIKPR